MGENEGAHAQFQTNILSNNLKVHIYYFYSLKKFYPNELWIKIKVPVTDPIGLMDMGSGSIQLSYIPDS